MNEQLKFTGDSQFGSIGHPVRRKEDVRLLTGKGRYTDDVHFDGEAITTQRPAEVMRRGLPPRDIAAAVPGFTDIRIVLRPVFNADRLSSYVFFAASMADTFCVYSSPARPKR